MLSAVECLHPCNSQLGLLWAQPCIGQRPVACYSLQGKSTLAMHTRSQYVTAQVFWCFLKSSTVQHTESQCAKGAQASQPRRSSKTNTHPVNSALAEFA